MQNNKSDVISLSRLVLSIWSRLPLIVICGFLGLFLGLGYFYTQSDIYSVSADAKISYIAGVDNSIPNEIIYFLTSDSNLSRFVDENHSLHSIKKDFNVKFDGYTNYIHFSIYETDAPEWWNNLILDSISEINNYLVNTYKQKANITLAKLEKEIEEIEKISNSSDDKSIYSNLILQHSNLATNITIFENALELIENPKFGENQKTSQILLGIIGGFIGGIIGIILALISIFRDNHIQFTEDIKSRITTPDVIISIPEYKDINNFDNRYFDYIRANIEKDKTQIAIISNHKGSGVHTIASGLRQAYLRHNETKQILAENSFCEDPSILDNIVSADKIIIVIRKDKDTEFEVQNLYNTLNCSECKNISFILNYASICDKSSVMYSNKRQYRKLKYRYW